MANEFYPQSAPRAMLRLLATLRGVVAAARGLVVAWRGCRDFHHGLLGQISRRRALTHEAEAYSTEADAMSWQIRIARSRFARIPASRSD